MTAAQGWWIVVDLTILVLFMIAMLAGILITVIKTARKVGEATDSVQTQVKSVTDKAHAVIDQAQRTVGIVTAKVSAFEKVISSVAGVVTGAHLAKSATKVAKGSTGMANSVLAGIKAGIDKFTHAESNGRGKHNDG